MDKTCLLYTSDAADERSSVDLGGRRIIKKNIGKAVPKEYPITAPIPPQVAAEAGPNKIHAPKADAVKLVVSEKTPIFLLAVR